MFQEIINTISNYKDQISLVSNIVTILAFALAIAAFFNWKREQKNAKKLDYIMELEDIFEILIHNIKTQLKNIYDAQNFLINIDQESKEKREELKISIEKSQIEKQAALDKIFFEYSLALLKVKRFLKKIDEECTALHISSLDELKKELINIHPIIGVDKETLSNESKIFLQKIKKNHAEGLAHLQKQYK